MRNRVNITSRQSRRARDVGRNGPPLHRRTEGGVTEATSQLGDGIRGGGRLFLDFRFDFRRGQRGARNRTVRHQGHSQQNRLQRASTPPVGGFVSGGEQRAIHGAYARRRPQIRLPNLSAAADTSSSRLGKSQRGLGRRGGSGASLSTSTLDTSDGRKSGEKQPPALPGGSATRATPAGMVTDPPGGARGCNQS
jgi:hypothetical protein